VLGRWILIVLLVMMPLFSLNASTDITQQESEMMEHYHVEIEAVRPVAKQPFRLRLQIYQADGVTPVTEFDEVHTKLLHLIVVSEDLTEFHHLHPEYEGDGRFVLDEAVLPSANNYVLVADFTPTGGHQEVARLNLSTENAEHKHAHLTVSESETVQVTLRFQLDLPDKLNAGEGTTVNFHVTDAETGEPVTTLDEYLGAAGHLVIIDEDGQIYLHTHPADAGHDMSNMQMKMEYGRI
jgi:hypothetical protein